MGYDATVICYSILTICLLQVSVVQSSNVHSKRIWAFLVLSSTQWQVLDSLLLPLLRPCIGHLQQGP